MQDLEQQREAVVDAAKRDGFNEIILVEDVESAVKLSEEERQGLNKLKEHILKDSSITAVYTYEISRISRQAKVVYSIRDFLISHNIQLIVLNPYFKMLKDDGTLSETSNIFFGIFSSMAENEGYIRKARMKRGVMKKKAMGMHAGGQVMYGYKTVKTENGYKYVIDDVKATVVRRIFNEYVYGGKSIRLLTRELQEEGIFTNVRYLTAVQEVYNILHRECYTGIKKGMPPIISEEIYRLSVDKRKNNELKINHTPNMMLLKGILRDANTNLILSSNTASKSYYSKRMKGVSVMAHVIEPVIWEHAVLLHNEYMKMDKEKMKKNVTDGIQRNMRKQKALDDKMQEIEKKHDAIEERLIYGRLSNDKAEKMHDDLDKEEKEVKTRIKEIQEEYEYYIKIGEGIEKAGKMKIDYNNCNDGERYDIVHMMIDKVMLSRDSKYRLNIEIYNKTDDKVKKIELYTYPHKKT